MASAEQSKRNPTVLWAQRTNLLYLTIEVEDAKIDRMDCEGAKFAIAGSNNRGLSFDFELELHAELKWSERQQVDSSRHLVFIVPKAEPKWWPRLLSGSTKLPWIKVDFDKWVEEDEQEDPSCDTFFQQIYKNLDEDGRRAMAKSYSESAGTVLSTNWKDVGSKKVDVKPPTGMEFKEYEK